MSVEGEPILVVDDEPAVREVVSEKLSSAGYRCTMASSTMDALQKLEKEAFSLALLDIRMPGASGMDLLREIKITYPETAVIMVTAVEDAVTAVEAMRLGASDYMVKPLSLNTLVLTAQRALETRRIILENREYRLHLDEKVQEETDKARGLFLSTLVMIGKELENQTSYWQNHSERASAVGAAVAAELSLPKDIVEKVRLGLQLHDIGKVGVKAEVLYKPGKLSPQEFEELLRHPAVGVRLVKPIMDDPDVMAAIKYHHEHWDGSGWPERLKGPEIPLAARIAAVADAFVAMTSPRPHRSALLAEEAREEILSSSGKLFDPHIVAAFSRLPVRELVSAQASSE